MRHHVVFPAALGPSTTTITRTRLPDLASDQVTSGTEVSGYLVGSPAFKAGGRGDPTPAGSIPVHLRHGGGTMTTMRTRCAVAALLIVIASCGSGSGGKVGEARSSLKRVSYEASDATAGAQSVDELGLALLRANAGAKNGN